MSYLLTTLSSKSKIKTYFSHEIENETANGLSLTDSMYHGQVRSFSTLYWAACNCISFKNIHYTYADIFFSKGQLILGTLFILYMYLF